MSDAAKIGSYVMYGKTGVCLVKEQTVMNGGQYYVLSPIGDRHSSVYVPCSNEELVGRMRPLLSREEIDLLLSNADDVRLEWLEDRNERSSFCRAVLNSGDRKALVRLLCCLMRRKIERIEMGKRLSAMDETFLQECVRLVQEEFSMVLDIPQREVGPYIQERL